MKNQNYNFQCLSDEECKMVSGGVSESDFVVPDERYEVDPDRKKKKRVENIYNPRSFTDVP